jgi:hypothetical protein
VSGAIVAGLLVADGIGFKAMNTGWERLGIDFGRWELVVGAVGLVIMAVQNPDGIAGAGQRLRRRRRRPAAQETVVASEAVTA